MNYVLKLFLQQGAVFLRGDTWGQFCFWAGWMRKYHQSPFQPIIGVRGGLAAAFPLSVFAYDSLFDQNLFQKKLITHFGFHCCLLASSFWRNSEGETMNELNQSQRSCNFNEFWIQVPPKLFLQDLLSTVTVCFGLLEECVNGTSNHWQSKRDLCYVCRVL